MSGAKSQILDFKYLKIDKGKSRDTGMAVVLIFLLASLYFENPALISWAVIGLVITMTIPIVFKPLAYIWFGLAHILGSFFSKIILTLTYFILVLPIGVIRRISGKDPLQLSNWKKSGQTAFRSRNHLYSSMDIEKPY